MSINYTATDNYLWSVRKYLMNRYGLDIACRDTHVLYWYVKTGRASVAFLHKLLAAKPYMIGRLLHQGGSDAEMIIRIKNYLGE